VRTADLKIEDVAFGGKGVGRQGGKAVFVPFTIDGETVSTRIVREKKQFAEAELVDIRERSPSRVEPPCPYFGRCGGCVYQHIAYEHQLAIKWRQVRDVLRRIGKLQDVPMRPIIPSPAQYGYRNRVTVHARDGVIGYFRRDSHDLIDIERCPIAVDEVNEELARLRSGRVYDGHYTLRAESASLKAMVRSAASPPESATRSENPFHHFSQTNDAVAMVLRDLITQLVPPDRDHGLLIDAFCGAGFFAKSLLGKFQRVIGIDWDRFAIAAAKKEATPKETYIAGDVEEELKRLLRSANGVEAAVSAAESPDLRVRTRAVTIIVDPPATGLSTSVRKMIADFFPETFIYVSCNPATLARDLADLRNRFALESVTPLDMFPQTAEIEVLAHLRNPAFAS
jgi:tRNA/tmRNA/rRNA uracil-C5-methylase (TrmA/RlmC/RlmD family)